MLYRGKIQPIARVIEADMPRAEGRIEQLLDQLESYLRLAAPQTAPEARAGAASRDDDAGGATPPE